MKTVAYDIAQVLVANSVGTLGEAESGWSILIGLMVDEIDPMISLHTVNQDHQKYYDRASNGYLYYCDFQVLVRGLPQQYEEPYAKADAIHKLLEGLDAFVTSDGTDSMYYANVIVTSNIYLGFDAQRRHTWSINGIAFRVLNSQV